MQPDAELTPLADALAHLQARVQPLSDSQSLPLPAALGRVLATAVDSPMDVPPWDNSSVDGYAVRCAELTEDFNELPLSQHIPAGFAPTPLQPGSCARIFTGAPLPEGADAVVMQEFCRDGGRQDSVLLPRAEPGQNIRRRGLDNRAGRRVFEAGRRLKAADLGLLASLGLAAMPCIRPVRVALLSSGDELLEPGSGSPGPGQIFDANRYTLTGLLAAPGIEPGIEIVSFERMPDRAEDTRAALARATAGSDLVVSTGGASVGAADHLVQVLRDRRALEVWRLAIKPGKPLAFGVLDGTPVVALPGNPAAVFVCFHLLVRPLLSVLAGAGLVLPVAQPLPAGFAFDNPGPRDHYLFARVRRDHGKNDNDSSRVQIHPLQASFALSAAAWAQGLARVPAASSLQEGKTVEFFGFSEADAY